MRAFNDGVRQRPVVLTPRPEESVDLPVVAVPLHVCSDKGERRAVGEVCGEGAVVGLIGAGLVCGASAGLKRKTKQHAQDEIHLLLRVRESDPGEGAWQGQKLDVEFPADVGEQCRCVLGLDAVIEEGVIQGHGQHSEEDIVAVTEVGQTFQVRLRQDGAHLLPSLLVDASGIRPQESAERRTVWLPKPTFEDVSQRLHGEVAVQEFE